jgi:catechol 2,3-dioxygenase-like lactoylglutathione lyase family enzyme
MRDFNDAKAMAQSLRTALGEKSVAFSHAECLELVAKEFGFDNWNVLAAKIAANKPESEIRFSDTVPILRIFEETKAKEFYVGYLGFKVDFEHRFEPTLPLYIQVSRPGIVLHLSEHHGDGSPGIVVLVRMRGIEAFHREIGTRQAAGHNRPALENVDWGKQFQVWDPFGNRLRFNEPTS